jgi:hypothetical protein
MKFVLHKFKKSRSKFAAKFAANDILVYRELLPRLSRVFAATNKNFTATFAATLPGLCREFSGHLPRNFTAYLLRICRVITAYLLHIYRVF